MDVLKELLLAIWEFFLRVMNRFFDWFLELSLFNKLVVLNFPVCFFAIVLPVGKYYIFESWVRINNPVAVYLIGIVFIMFFTIYMGNLWGFVLRAVVNLWYLLWIVYIGLSGTVSHAPYELVYGFYFNMVAPVLFLVPSALQYFLNDR